MPFEGFLNDARARPVGLRALGYAASLAIHGPPLGFFVAAWLTRALVLDHSLDLPDYRRARAVYYEVPVQMMHGIPGDGAGAQGTSDSFTAGGIWAARVARAGSANGAAGGRWNFRWPSAEFGGRRCTRNLRSLVPRSSRPTTAWPGMPTASGGPSSRTRPAPAVVKTAMAAATAVPCSRRRARAWARPDEARRLAKGRGPDSDQARMAMWVPPEPKQKENRARKGRGELDGEGEEIDEGGVDDTALVGTPLPGKPLRVSMNYAAYLRTFEPFPTLPDSCWPPGRTTNTVLLEICVSERGEVSDVVVRESAGDEVDAHLTAAARTWRYRPRMVQGSARPFCHPIRLVYTRALRFDRSW